jgi:adenylate cyclase
VRAHLQRILASTEFASATRLQQFLAFVVEQRLEGADSLKETELAIRLFHRGSSFDPSGDSIVRVAASNLRHRLRSYYQGTGAADRLLIDLPKGTYVPVFTRREAGAPPKRPGSSPRRARLWRIASGVAAACLTAALVWHVWMRPSTIPPASLAVLPFLNLNSTPDSGYLADGLVDELTSALSHVEGLRVASRTSAFQFRGTNIDVREAGRKLGVATILEGSVRIVGSRIKVNTQLIQVSDGFHIWSQTAEGGAEDLFLIQVELTRGIASALQLRASPAPAAAPHREAYDLFLRGQYFRDRITPDDLVRSLRYLQAAVDKDPSYAPARAALAGTYATLAYYEPAPDPAKIQRAKAEAGEALKRNPNLASAHALLAWIRYFNDWDWKGSEEGLRHSLILNPNSAEAHDWLAQRLMAEGRFEEAIDESTRALQLDPLNYRLTTNLGVALYLQGSYEEAIRQSRVALELNPSHYKAHTLIGVSLQELGRHTQALAALQTAGQANPADADTLAHTATVLLALGRREEALVVRRLLESGDLVRQKPFYDLAHIQVAMGEKDGAFASLEESFRLRSSDIPVLKVDPAFRTLHQDPRFAALLHRIGLSPEMR